MLAKLSFGLKDLFPYQKTLSGEDQWRASGFTDAFEGPVDVANRVAELLMLRQGLSRALLQGVGRWGGVELRPQQLRRAAEDDEALGGVRGGLRNSFDSKKSIYKYYK